MDKQEMPKLITEEALVNAVEEMGAVVDYLDEQVSKYGSFRLAAQEAGEGPSESLWKGKHHEAELAFSRALRVKGLLHSALDEMEAGEG